MRLSILAIVSVLTLIGCDSEYDKQVQATQEKIQATARADWKSGIPFDRIVDAKSYCNKNAGLKYCDLIDDQIIDIASALSSCAADQRTTLCKKTIRILSQSKILPLLPKSAAVELPTNPFYWKLPNAMLDSLSDQENYRGDITLFWWNRWKLIIILCGALFVTITATWAWWRHDAKSKAALATLAAEKKAELIAQEKIRRQKQEAARIEAEQQERLALEAAEAEQERIQAEQLEKEQVASAAAKLAAEQSEAAYILQIAFKCATPKQKKLKPSELSASISNSKKSVDR